MNLDRSSIPPLHRAVLYGKHDLIKSLLDGGVDVNESHNFYNAPIHVAARKGCPETVKYLLERGADVNERTRLMGKKYTALHIAVKIGNADLVRLLLRSKAEVDAKSDEQWTPLHTGCKYQTEGSEEITKLLLGRRASVEARTRDELTPLKVACLSRNDVAARLLLAHGAQLNVRDETGRVELHYAVGEVDEQRVYHAEPYDPRSSQRRLVGALLSRGADVHARDANGRTPLFHAVQAYDVATSRALLVAGAEVDLADADGCAPLHCFVSGGISKSFIRDNCKKYGCSPEFPELIESTQAEMIRLLAGWGADVDARQRTGAVSALHVAASKNHDGMVAVLLEAGAQVDGTNCRGCTSLHLAATYDCLEAVRLLLSHGADVNLLNDEGKSPLQCAADSGETCEALQKHVLKMKLAELRVSEENELELCGLDEKLCAEYCVKCLEQLQAMRETRFHETTVSFHDVMTKSPIQVSTLLRNRTVAAALESADYKETFTEYADFVANSYRRASRRLQLLDEVWQSDLLCCIFSNVPRVCVEKILNYLDIDDLESLTE